jgi:hypothetical protein
LALSERELVVTVRRDAAEQGTHCSYRHECRVPWGEVESIDEFDSHAFIVTRGSAAAFIPKGIFKDALAFREFVGAVRRLRAGVPTTAITAALPPPPAQGAIQAGSAP